MTSEGPPPRRPSPEPSREPGAPPRPPVVSIANGLWVQDGLAVGEDFLRTLAEQYGAGARTVDFTSAGVKEATDAWVREQTADRITTLFGELPTRTKLVLANAVYLKADWVLPFYESPTRDQPFTRTDGSTVDVPMMSSRSRLRYASGTGWQAVELPYAGGELAMRVLVPTGTATPGDLLRPRTLDAVAAGLRPATVDLALPKWDFDTDLDLVPLLTTLGLTLPFGEGADLSGIAAGLHVDQAIHRATITVDEWGTEAAAVTGLAVATSGRPRPEVTMRADRPFAFSIVHLPTGAPLFLGSVQDPSKTR